MVPGRGIRDLEQRAEKKKAAACCIDTFHHLQFPLETKPEESVFVSFMRNYI